MVHPDSDRVPRVPSYSGIPPVVLRFRLRDFHPLRSDFPVCSASIFLLYAEPYNPELHVARFGLIRVRSPLLTESFLISLPGVT